MQSDSKNFAALARFDKFTFVPQEALSVFICNPCTARKTSGYAGNVCIRKECKATGLTTKEKKTF
jgi:hypothetical protein